MCKPKKLCQPAREPPLPYLRNPSIQTDRNVRCLGDQVCNFGQPIVQEGGWWASIMVPRSIRSYKKYAWSPRKNLWGTPGWHKNVIATYKIWLLLTKYSPRLYYICQRLSSLPTSCQHSACPGNRIPTNCKIMAIQRMGHGLDRKD